MGMFDTVFVSREVLSGLPFDCPACGRVPGPDAEWQTKSLNAAMDSYVLRHDERGSIRLYLLDRPSDRRPCGELPLFLMGCRFSPMSRRFFS